MNTIDIETELPQNLMTDFMNFLKYFELKGAKLTKARQNLARKDLVALYERMSEPKLEVSPKSDQAAYPLLHLFFHLALDLQLLQKKSMNSGTVVVLNLKKHQAYQQLTMTEQYVTLLKCFWMKSDWEELQERFGRSGIYGIETVFEYLVEKPVQSKIDARLGTFLRRTTYDYENFLYYFSYFGLWDFERDESSSTGTRYFMAKSITVHPLLKKLCEPLLEALEYKLAIMDEAEGDGLSGLFSLLGMEMLEEEEEDEILPIEELSFLELVKPLFPRGQLNTLLEEDQLITSGRYLFKVSLEPSIWRTIQLSHEHTLLDLHTLIQQAFDFDDDHLYTFFMDGKRSSRKKYESPMDFDGPFVQSAKIGQIGLYEGQRILYLFDYGDEWEFWVEVVSITPTEEITSAAICSSKGQAPAQYPYWE